MSAAALPYDAVAASQALAAADPALGDVIARVGPPEIGYRPTEVLDALLRSVVYQQLSGTAAATIWGRVLDRFAPGAPRDPQDPVEGGRLSDALSHHIAAAPDDDLRACGLSRAKTAAARDLVRRYDDGTLLARADLEELDDDTAVAALTPVRGVGVWTAQMVLVSTLGRPDVWPVGDLGVREGYRLVSGAAERPTPAALEAAGEPYRPWRSVAAWYLWRAVDLSRAGG